MHEIRIRLKELLSEKRYRHSLGVADEAVRLAKRYGTDEWKAYLAGLVHDCCKNFSYDDMLKWANRLEVDLDIVSLSNEKLMHATVGASYARQVFEIEDSEVIDAIAYHTTGRAGMTLLDKIIYMADYIEPTRKDYPWLDRMRKLAYENLDEAVIYGLDVAIGYLVQDGMLIHKNTIEARNDLLLADEKEE